MTEQVPAGAGWGTWTAERPAEIVHPTLGVTLTPLLYSASANDVSLIPPAATTLLGTRGLDGRTACLRTSHAGTTLDWRFTFHDTEVEIDWRAQASGEWGLRFWVVLCVRGSHDETWYARNDGTLHGQVGANRVGLQAVYAPLLTTFHDDLEALCHELVEYGYFYLSSRGESGRCAAMRFNLEEAPRQRITCYLNEISPGFSILPDEAWPLSVKVPGRSQQALQALNDVVRWNHVYDSVNQRPYTALTRFWSTSKFGGFGIWLDDVAFHAWLWGHIDPSIAKDNVAAIFAWQTVAGNFPCLVTGNDAWLDRSQIPILSYVVWNLYQRSGDRALLEWAFPRLLANFDWWWRCRELNGAGLVAYGTSPDIGRGLYQNTKLGAKNESAMDNSPVHDDALFDPATGLLQCYDVGLNSLLALDNEMLVAMADALGDNVSLERLRASHQAHLSCIRDHLWDMQREVFANRLPDGRFVRQLAPTSFYPLVAGAATPEQAATMVEHYLLPQHKFGGTFSLPSVARDDPSYGDNVYWRGRIWPPLNFWVHRGLRRCGFDAQAARLADQSWQLFQSGWEHRVCGENFHAETGAITDQPDTDTFYTWGALMPALSIAEVCDVTPWDGLSIASDRLDGPLGPLQTALGRLCIEPLPNGGHRLLRGSDILWETSLRGCICWIEWRSGTLQMQLPVGQAGDWLRLGRSYAITDATLEDVLVEVVEGHTLWLPARSEKMRLCLSLS
ncbi:MGH1-like glycoside hydrolase domain-containing protein [Halomonas salipaludis]|uniref:Glycoside hydrolase family 37 n=1 Tax=Halomonas salipaludis TaxID=2032625 RepID=A0A2A2EPY6_9GAMM|nr:trehalase family glycosidase [Halomonas salipaludis]PAU75166.1 glycoside hydrolase family 37 [Halomonas salipaludis]